MNTRTELLTIIAKAETGLATLRRAYEDTPVHDLTSDYKYQDVLKGEWAFLHMAQDYHEVDLSNEIAAIQSDIDWRWGDNDVQYDDATERLMEQAKWLLLGKPLKVAA